MWFVRLICILLLLGGASLGAIAPGPSTGCSAASGTTLSCAAPGLAFTAGDTIVLMMASAQSGYSIADTCSNTWVQQYLGTTRNQVWIGTGGTTNASCVITSSRPTGSDGLQTWVAQDYSGVSGQIYLATVAPACGTASAGSTTTCSTTRALQNNGNYALLMISLNTGSSTSSTFTAATGTLRGVEFGSSYAVGMVDNTANPAATVTVAATYGATTTSVAAGMLMELQASQAAPVAPFSYYAPPPFVAGPGISLQAGPTGILICAPTCPARSRLAGVVLVRNLRVLAEGCSLVTHVALGVRARDVIDLSETHEHFTVYAFASFNHVNFRVCNPGHVLRSANFPLRWQVRR